MHWLSDSLIGTVLGHLVLLNWMEVLNMMIVIAANRYIAVARPNRVIFIILYLNFL